jgi:hypothetical protein
VADAVDTSISIVAAVTVVAVVVVVVDGMVAGMVVAMHFMMTIAIAIAIVVVVGVPADGTVYILRSFVHQLTPRPEAREEMNKHTDPNTLAHLPCLTAYSARIEWLRAEAVEFGGGGAGWIIVICVLGYSSLRMKRMLVCSLACF